MKSRVFWILLMAISWGVVEALSYFGLSRLADGVLVRPHTYNPADTLSDYHRQILNRLMVETPEYMVFDAELGWAIRPDGRKDLNQRGRDRTFSYVANSQGLRADTDFDLEPPRNGVRVAAFGDSFTHGDDVDNAEAWPAVLDRNDSGLEVLNFGVSGFGLGQAYLRYQRLGRTFEPDIVLIGFMSENIYRNVNVWRGFYMPDGHFPLTKPRYRVEEGKLTLLPNPMRAMVDYQRLLDHPTDTLHDLGRYDAIYPLRYRAGPFDFSPTVRLSKLVGEKLRDRFMGDGIIERGIYNTESEAFAVTTALFDAFREAAIADGAQPIILVFPTHPDMYDQQAGRPIRYGPLLDYFDSRGYGFVDMMPVLIDGFGDGYDVNAIFWRHYSPMANAVVARAVSDYLDENGILDTVGRAGVKPGEDSALTR